ncbi:hypothetical protein [Hyunsoonleella pacifica]|uniref:GLPGLI family protein n=1 Tax=Hyunsoonleella pacifica TaxID=1080224 RepID=A0A4Q9FPR9_9FLAO|nr:hypothetical protein [Hyunsoonleella pacifica]TBN17411.1 hypothetical protein EYD46_03600 [Hyunsoonleella pacifica]GGD12173.1 hypothetical protein GCM10011368_12720 [Hyunsoonleella pacifica]
MRKIIRLFAIIAIFWSTTAINAQENTALDNSDFYAETLKEMPSLDFNGDYKYYSETDVLGKTISQKKNNTIGSQFYRDLYEEMPSLNFFGEDKSISPLNKTQASTLKKDKATEKKTFLDELTEELPSIRF